MKKSLTRRVPLFVTMLTAALIVVGWRVGSAGPCIGDGQTCRTSESCCSGVCVKSSKKSFGTCCTPTTCAAVGANCGMIADGCGGTLDCGTCTLPQTCGGGGTPNVCGSTTTVSLAGWWRAQDTGSPGGAVLVEVTQTGDTVTIPVALSSFPGQLTGTITGVGEFNLTGVGYPCSFGPLFPGRLLPGASVLDGFYLCPSPTTSLGRLTLTRCTCHDGNTVDGDGCDAACQVEPCFTCAGDPSACTATPDGGACDDRQDCTTGETCTAGICGGGSMVVGCTDTTGVWQVTSEELGVPQSGVAEVVQRGGIVTFGGIPTGFNGVQDYIGTIDPGTGAFDVAFPGVAFAIGCPVFSPLTGVAGVNAFSSSGSEYVARRPTCESFLLTVTGTRIP